MGNASQINRSRNSVRVERRSDLNEPNLGEVYCICIYIIELNTRRVPVEREIINVYDVFEI